ncbi:MAG: zinc ribbon domain-containing protein [Bacteroidetes bacterium]|nr:zinc ribbon domain-containing protein [Bacteroidota bacterium]
MPTYDYACKECGHRFEAFQSMSEPVLTHCPKCEAEALQRLIGAGAGLVFKGSGFYLTDYKKTGSTPANGSASGKSSNGSSSSASEAPSAAPSKESGTPSSSRTEKSSS